MIHSNHNTLNALQPTRIYWYQYSAFLYMEMPVVDSDHIHKATMSVEGEQGEW